MAILHELRALVVGYDMVTSHLPVEDGCTNWVDIQETYHLCKVTYRVKSEEEVVNGGVAEMKGRLGFVLLLINPNDKVSLEHAAPLVPKIRGIFKHDLICVVNLQGLGPATGYVTDWEQVPVSEQEVLKAFEGSGEAPLVLSCSSSDAGSWEAMMVKAAQKLLKEKEGHKSPLLPHLMCCLM